MAKSIKVDKDGMVMLSAFYDWLDIGRVKFYNVKFNKDGTITIKFYDSKKKLVKPYAQ